MTMSGNLMACGTYAGHKPAWRRCIGRRYVTDRAAVIHRVEQSFMVTLLTPITLVTLSHSTSFELVSFANMNPVRNGFL